MFPDIEEYWFDRIKPLHYYVYEMQKKMKLNEKRISDQTALFAALADPTRLKLIEVLCRQDPPGCRCVKNLSNLIGITQPAVSQHMRVLKAVGLVIGEKRGFRTHYQIVPEGLKRCQGILSTTLDYK